VEREGEREKQRWERKEDKRAKGKQKAVEKEGKEQKNKRSWEKKRGVVTRNRLWDIGRCPRKSSLFFLTVIFFTFIQFGNKMNKREEAKNPGNRLSGERERWLERASQVFEESSAFPNNPWKSEFVLFIIFVVCSLFTHQTQLLLLTVWKTYKRIIHSPSFN